MGSHDQHTVKDLLVHLPRLLLLRQFETRFNALGAHQSPLGDLRSHDV